MSRPRPRPTPRPRPIDWQSELRAEIAAAVRQRRAEGFEVGDALHLVAETATAAVSQAIAAGLVEGEAP